MAKNIQNLFDSDLLYLDDDFADRDAFFHTMGTRLTARGLVKDSFGRALGEREKVCPTGLATEPYPVALPHTDEGHVLEERIAFVRFRSPVEFRHMGDPGIVIQARFAFVLAIKDAHRLVKALSSLIMMLSNQEAMAKLKRSDDRDRIYAMLRHAIKSARMYAP